jgi:NarL family two-component system sensor histidine kinase LiaS
VKPGDTIIFASADGKTLKTVTIVGVYARTPIVGINGTMRGVLAMKILQPDIFQLTKGLLQLIVFSMIVVTTLAAIVGLIFGSLNAKGLTRRLKSLSSAADRWSEGDFSAFTHDTSQDEVGQLARQLNSMAAQLQQLLQTRQKLDRTQAAVTAWQQGLMQRKLES